VCFRGLRNSLGCFSHVKNIDLHYITLHYTTRLSRLPVDRRRCDAGQAGSYAQPPDRPHAATLYATQNGGADIPAFIAAKLVLELATTGDARLS